MTGDQAWLTAWLPDSWPIGLTLLVVITVHVLTPAATGLPAPYDSLAHTALVAVLVVAAIGSASRLYGLLQRHRRTDTPA
jgi:hypothetical protein